ncbi:hypothetical protein AB0H98_10105 [Nocardia salmonicida]|uniref:hypothetical protein n=1 Tax=Nocardia salmonicida TaxID=53431 RepID=UPI0033CE1D5D
MERRGPESARHRRTRSAHAPAWVRNARHGMFAANTAPAGTPAADASLAATTDRADDDSTSK